MFENYSTESACEYNCCLCHSFTYECPISCSIKCCDYRLYNEPAPQTPCHCFEGMLPLHCPTDIDSPANRTKNSFALYRFSSVVNPYDIDWLHTTPMTPTPWKKSFCVSRVSCARSIYLLSVELIGMMSKGSSLDN